jgi:hypothetical protein
MPTPRRRFSLPAATAALLVTVVVTACASASPASPTPTGSLAPTAGPEASPSDGGGTGMDYPTGPTDVVLRLDEGGGMMMVDWVLTQAPTFTLYGDGTVLYRDPAAQPPIGPNGRLVMNPFRTARLGPEQIVALLDFAISEGGLGAARERYEHPGVADAGTVTFTINAGGREKTVEVYALGPDEGAPDPLIRAQFLALAERLRTFEETDGLPMDDYAPAAWRAVLVESPGAPGPVAPWPWPDIDPSDFVAVADDPNAPTFPSHLLTADDIEAIGIGELSGGVMGYYAAGPDGTTYSIPIRPLLPDEER